MENAHGLPVAFITVASCVSLRTPPRGVSVCVQMFDFCARTRFYDFCTCSSSEVGQALPLAVPIYVSKTTYQGTLITTEKLSLVQ